jgi:hypothetical protein
MNIKKSTKSKPQRKSEDMNQRRTGDIKKVKKARKKARKEKRAEVRKSREFRSKTPSKITLLVEGRQWFYI